MKLSKIVKLVRNRLKQLSDDRPIHILGVGGAKKILPLSIMGADTFDCHSPWRRASEDKLMIPLLSSDFDIIARDAKYWKYILLNDIDDLYCDCNVCQEYSLSQLKQLNEGTREEKYFFRILAYRHNIHQEETLCELARSEIPIKPLIEDFPESRYKDKLLGLLSTPD